jgi:tetratricopeptide (TPR) repeat protein
MRRPAAYSPAPLLPLPLYAASKLLNTHSHDHLLLLLLLLQALNMYREVLKQQPDNIYAVNGLGTCLAELGHTAAAKQAFDEVMRASAKTKGFVRLPETYVNIGNLWLARQQYSDALTMYEHASKIHNHKNAQVRGVFDGK